MPRIGRKLNLGFATESVRNTAETTANVWLPKMDMSIQLQNEMFEDTSGVGRREGLVGHEIVNQRLAGSLSGVMDADYLGYHLKHVFGTVATAQEGTTGAYTHEFTVNQLAQIPTFTLFYDRGAEGQFKARGCAFQSFELQFSTEDAQYSGEIIGLEEMADSGQTSAYAKPVNYLLGKNAKLYTAATVADTDVVEDRTEAIIRNASITYNTNADFDLALGNVNPHDIHSKQFLVELSITAVVRGNQQYLDFKNNIKRAYKLDAIGTNLADIGTSALKPRLEQYLANGYGEVTYAQANDEVITFDMLVRSELSIAEALMCKVRLTNGIESLN